MEPLVKNAADEEQVKKAARKEKSEEDRFQNAMLDMLDSKPGRLVLWKILEHCRVFGSVFQEGRVEYNAGKQDVGHFLMGKITEARPEALIEMMREKQNA